MIELELLADNPDFSPDVNKTNESVFICIICILFY